MEMKDIRKSLVRKTDFDYGEFGKLPPRAREMEVMVLGAILMESTAMTEVGRFLKPEMFYVDAHQKIYQAMVVLAIENNPIDLETVCHQLKKLGFLDVAGGPYYVARLMNTIGSAANVEYHALVVKEEWMKRMAIAISADTMREAYDDQSDPFDVLGDAVSKFSELLNDTSQQEARSWVEVLDDKITAIKEASEKPEDQKFVIGKPTGLYTLDRKSLGFKDTNLIILAGRPAEGKSTLMVQGAHINARKGVPVGIFSLEMSADELMDKFISIETDINSSKIMTGELTPKEWTRLLEARSKMLDWPIYINDVGGITINEIEAIAKVWRAKNKIEMLFIDYLQLVEVPQQKGAFTNREQELSKISRRLKKLAKNLGIPVICLAALSREMDKRPVPDRRPKLTDLRESGAIEQDANMVIFVFRPEEHGINAFSDGSTTKGVTEFIIAKNRMGPKGITRAKFLGASNRFDDTEYSTFEQEYVEKKKEVGSAEFKSEQKDEDTPF